MDPFFIMQNEDKTFRIECKIVIYRHLLQFHPNFVHPIGDDIDGFYTKYYFLIKDNISTKEEAKIETKQLNEMYKNIIEHAENTGDWEKFPFKNNTIIYYK